MKLLIYSILVFNCLTLKAQSSVDVEDIFKLELFLDNKFPNNSSTEDFCKNDSLYQVFSNSTELYIDTLEVESELYELRDPFQYYKIDLKKVHQKLSSDVLESLSLSYGFNSICILAINPNTGLTYRLRGFNGNDYLTFLQDFKEIYKEQTGNTLSSNTLIKKYKLPEVDFKCLYKGLKANSRDTRKYPCLIRHSDPFQIE